MIRFKPSIGNDNDNDNEEPITLEKNGYGRKRRLDVQPVIAIRNNAPTEATGCQLRREELLLIKKLGYQRWKQIKDAGKRWIAETVFFDQKSPRRRSIFKKV
jgi:hypothetical protein